MNWPGHKSVGTLIVTPEGRKLHVAVDEGIVDVARALLPKSVHLNRTRFDPHITTVREEPVDPILWPEALRLQGRPVEFSYDPRVVAGEVYWWLRVWSDDLVSIRRSLGLPDLSRLTRPPDNEDCFHITIGNTKGLT